MKGKQNIQQNIKQKIKQTGQQKKTNGMSKFDIIKWSLIILSFLLGFSANYYYNQYPLSIRMIGWLILIGIILAIASQTQQGRRAWKFFREAQVEIKKVVWPTRQETFQMTLIIITIVVVFSLIIWVVDMFLMWAINGLTGQ